MGSKQTIPIQLGSQRHLLFDDLFLEKPRGITLRMNPPFQQPGAVLVADKPWEQLGIGAYNTVMRENDKFRMWYDAITRDHKSQTRRFLCYAESQDGVHWEKPELGLVMFNGTRNNNIVAPTAPNASQQGGTVFRDEQAKESERYKLWTKYQATAAENKRGIRTGLWAMVSPDGLRWKLTPEGYPLSRGNAADTQSICFWDNDIQKYVGFVRIKKFPKGRQRTCSVGVMTSDDFRHWTEAAEVLRADEQMPVPGGKPEWHPVVDFYTPGGMKVPGVPNAYILLPTAYYHWRQDAFPSNIDVSLATSRDRINWWRPTDQEPFLRLGPDSSATSGMVFANPWPIPVGDELWIYYAGIGRDHRQEVKDPSLTGIFRTRLRRDGFVSAAAGYAGGEFTTPVVTFNGRRLELNMDGSAGGWGLVGIFSESGKPIEGYKIEQCDTIRGNSVEKLVTWQGNADLSKMAGKPVRLRFVMRAMKIFAFQFGK